MWGWWVASFKQTMSLLEQQRSKFVSVRKYLQAAEIVQQVSESRKKMRDLQSELANIQKKENSHSRNCGDKDKAELLKTLHCLVYLQV